jgi:hypothetical protein
LDENDILSFKFQSSVNDANTGLVANGFSVTIAQVN